MRNPSVIPNAKTKLKYGQFVLHSIQGRPGRVGVVMKVSESDGYCAVHLHFGTEVAIVSAEFVAPTKRRIELPDSAWVVIRETACNDRTARIMSGLAPAK